MYYEATLMYVTSKCVLQDNRKLRKTNKYLILSMLKLNFELHFTPSMYMGMGGYSYLRKNRN